MFHRYRFSVYYREYLETSFFRRLVPATPLLLVVGIIWTIIDPETGGMILGAGGLFLAITIITIILAIRELKAELRIEEAKIKWIKEGTIPENLNNINYNLDGYRSIFSNFEDEKAIDFFRTELNVGDIYFRFNATTKIGLIGDKRAVTPLLEVLNYKNPLLRSAVVRSLGAIGELKAVEPLKHLLNSENDSTVKTVIEDVLKKLEMRKD